MGLALFDLDNTLLEGDSDHLWGQFLVEAGIVDRDEYEQANEIFYQQYQAGELDIHEFCRFAFRPLVDNAVSELKAWRTQYFEQMIRPIMLETGMDKIAEHQDQGDEIIIITATNSFLTRPIAQAFGVSHLIATVPEQVDGVFTGEIDGTPCFQGGKVIRLNEWLEAHEVDLDESWFYSDSHNDLPLLNEVTTAIAVDPDEELLAIANQRDWEVLSFR